MNDTQRIPVTVIGGFLGAGKTTLVNHLIRSAPHHFGVIVNEFGSVGVDGGLIEAVRSDDDLDITELAAGCLCCSGRDDLLRALVALALRPEPPAHVLIELSGVADPVPVLGTLLEPQIRAAFRVDSLVAVADARNLRRTLQENREGARQLAYAGLVVLNKAAEVSEEVLSADEDAIQAINPLASIVRANHAQVVPETVLQRRDFGLHSAAAAMAGSDRITGDRVAGNAVAEVIPASGHTAGLVSFVVRAEHPLDPYGWQRFLREYILSRPAEVLRVKGYLAFDAQPGRILFQSVRDVFSAERLDVQPQNAQSPNSPMTSAGEAPKLTELVFIGRGLEKSEYAAALQACQVVR